MPQNIILPRIYYITRKQVSRSNFGKFVSQNKKRLNMVISHQRYTCGGKKRKKERKIPLKIIALTGLTQIGSTCEQQSWEKWKGTSRNHLRENTSREREHFRSKLRARTWIVNTWIFSVEKVSFHYLKFCLFLTKLCWLSLCLRSCMYN